MVSRIYEIFSSVARSMGYSPVHGKIIGVLLVKNRPVSLKELARETGYSTSMISLSLDLLEIFGIVKKFRKDRNLWIQLQGDLLSCLKRAFLLKLKKSIQDCRKELEEEREKARKEEKLAIEKLQKELKRLENYLKILE
ncbi:MAG: hypothetical protein DRP12_02270 [Candidatus Aenigmatarchaeota archaeon]|nr:MAG: hypothetical protein DRP12_02270 [Candidatus Aenigmarchaeota archaeon]